jgi:hypothetical protein
MKAQRFAMKPIIGVAAAGLIGAAMITGTPPAQADAASEYLAALRSRNIVPNDGDNAGAIDNAHIACDQLLSGRTQAQVADEWFTADSGHVSRDDAAFMVRMAIRYFCPTAA